MDYKVLAELQVFNFDNWDEFKRYLHLNLKKLKKDIFEDKETIVINIGDHDYYVSEKEYGTKLELIQSIINDIGIPENVITILTTNKNIDKEIKALTKDNKMLSAIINGRYEKVDFLNHEVKLKKRFSNYTYGEAIPTKIKLDDLTDKEKFLLMDSKVFCMYPWIHLNASPNGDAMPCCLWDYNQKMGSVKEHTIKELWNGRDWKSLRVNMLNEQQTPGCDRCYKEEQAGFFSARQSANKHHGHHIKRASNTSRDGHSSEFSMTYWDIRFSNLCNLSCRSCGHIFSSSWYQDQKSIAGENWAKNNKPLFWAGRHETDMLEQLMEHIDYVEQIYFAGGEPLTMDEHYIILEELEKRKKFDVRLVYNTNFTKTKLKDRYVFDYWRKFKSVSIGASLDAMGPRAEYIRHGTNWAEVERNREMMLEQCPNVDFYISPTLSIQNALHLPDFHRDWVERGFIRAQDLNVNILQDPAWLRIDIAPESYKEKIRSRYQEHLEWLRPLDELKRATQGFESALRFLETDNTELLPKFRERMTKLDDLRKENILEAIPELNELT